MNLSKVKTLKKRYSNHLTLAQLLMIFTIMVKKANAIKKKKYNNQSYLDDDTLSRFINEMNRMSTDIEYQRLHIQHHITKMHLLLDQGYIYSLEDFLNIFIVKKHDSIYLLPSEWFEIDNLLFNSYMSWRNEFKKIKALL